MLESAYCIGNGIAINSCSYVKHIEDLSVEISCLCRLLIYTDNDFDLIFGFNSSLQTIVFTLNLDS